MINLMMEGRWLIPLISNSGMRLNEIVGLNKGNVVFDSEYPVIILKPHLWRRLKPMGSEGTVPIVGSTIWAAKQAIQSSTTTSL